MLMSKERLEEIEAKYSILTVSSEKNGTEYTEVDVKDLVFLIQNGFKQVERVKKLEEDIKEWEIVNEQWEQINTQIAEQNKRYREALEFYAGEETYEPSEVQVGAVTKEGYKILKYKHDPIINTDKGKKARQALEGTE